MALPFSLTHRVIDSMVVISLSGYLEKTGGATLKGFLKSLLNDGFRFFVLDFSPIELVNSQGIAALLDVATKIVDENNGTVYSFGIPADKAAVLDLAGFFFLSAQVVDEQDALKTYQEGH